MKIKTAEQYMARFRKRGERNRPVHQSRGTDAKFLLAAIYGRPNYQKGYKPNHAERYTDIRNVFPTAPIFAIAGQNGPEHSHKS